MANFYCHELPRYPMEWTKVHVQRQRSYYGQIKTIIGNIHYKKGLLAYFLGVPSSIEVLQLANNTQLSLVLGKVYQNVFNGFNHNSHLCSLYKIAFPMLRNTVIYTIGSVRNHLPLNSVASPQQRLDMVKTLYKNNPHQRNEFKSVFGVILKMAKHGPSTLYKELVPSLLRNKSNTLITLMLYRQMLMGLGWMSPSKKVNASSDNDGKA